MLTLIKFLFVRHKLNKIEADISKAIATDFSLKEDSEYPFRTGKYSFWQNLSHEYTLYQFLMKKAKKLNYAKYT